MASTQCSIGTPNMAMAADGKLWVATVQGLAMLDLRHLPFNSAKPLIYVDEVTVGRERHPAGRELVLPPGTHHVELRFDSISGDIRAHIVIDSRLVKKPASATQHHLLRTITQSNRATFTLGPSGIPREEILDDLEVKRASLLAPDELCDTFAALSVPT